MELFEINGKEYELKLTYKSIKLLNGAFEGGSYEVIGRAIQGDLDAFPTIVHAALLHTDENISRKDVEERIEELIDSGELSFDGITKISDTVVTRSFFYAPTVEKMVKQSPELAKGLEQIRG